MKKKLPTQAVIALAIVVIGGGALAAEYFIVKWYPYYKGYRGAKALTLLPYQNDSLGVSMQIAAGIYGKVEDFPGGVKIHHRKIWGTGPSLTITSQVNPDHSEEFSPQLMAQWETNGTYQRIPNYNFEHAPIQKRDAALIWQRQGRFMLVTAHIISPDHIVEANCTPGSADESVYLQACELSLRSIKVAGPPPQPKPEPGIFELKSVIPPQPTHK